MEVLLLFIYLLARCLDAVTAMKTCLPTDIITSIRWAELNAEQVSSISVAVFPLGSTEAHGPHLPLGTDSLLAEAVATRASLNMSNVAVLPVSTFGASFEHSSLSGTISVRDSVLNSLWDDVFLAVVNSEVQKIVCINGHGGQTPNVAIAVRNVRFRHNVLAVAINLQAMMAEEFRKIGEPATTEVELEYGIHGGLIETSAILYLFPHLVDKSAIKNFPRTWLTSPAGVEPFGEVVSFGWRAEDIYESGAVGNASAASAELGEIIMNRVISRVRKIISEIQQSEYVPPIAT